MQIEWQIGPYSCDWTPEYGCGYFNIIEVDGPPTPADEYECLTLQSVMVQWFNMDGTPAGLGPASQVVGDKRRGKITGIEVLDMHEANFTTIAKDFDLMEVLWALKIWQNLALE